MKHKKIIIIGFFLCFIVACKKQATVPVFPQKTLGNTYQSHRYKDRLTTAQLTTRLSSFYSNVDSIIHPKYDVIVYRIFYTTHDYQNNAITASGLVYVPEINNYYCPVICFQHGTCIQKQEVPSISADLNYYVPFIMASESGAIVCAADYIGLGFSDGVAHFYEPTEEANAVTDMLGSVQVLLNKTLRKITFNSSVFLMGYSQGGHATLATQQQLETQYSAQFTLLASAPMASWFSLSKSSQLNILKDSVSFPFSAAYACLINSIQTIAHPYPGYDKIFIKPYDSLTNILFDGSKSAGYVNTQYPQVFRNTLRKDFIEELKHNNTNAFVTALQKIDIVEGWAPKAPTHFYHSILDEVAFYDNSVIAYNTFHQKGGNVQLINLGNYTHAEANLKAIQQVRDWFYPMVKITPY